QEDIKLSIPNDFQTTLDQQSINKTPLNLTAAYSQAPVKATTFDPITEFPDVFPEKIPNELLLLREPHMHHRIKLIDPEKIINPQVIPIVEKYYSQFREHMTKNLDSGRIYSFSSFRHQQCSVCLNQPILKLPTLSRTSELATSIQSRTGTHYHTFQQFSTVWQKPNTVQKLT